MYYFIFSSKKQTCLKFGNLLTKYLLSRPRPNEKQIHPELCNRLRFFRHSFVYHWKIQKKKSWKGSYTNHVDQAGGRGGFQIVHVSPQGGRGVNRMVHVDFFSGLEYIFSKNYLKNDNLHHIYSKNCEKKIFLNNLWIINL